MKKKSLRGVPEYVETEMVPFAEVPKQEERNIYGVQASKWVKWTVASRRLFNYLYAIGMKNPECIFASSIHDYGDPENLTDIQNCVSWNMAWKAADRVSNL